jgi:hypothetical protein
MGAMDVLPGARVSRRTFLAATAAGLGLLVAGCTSDDAPAADAVTDAQADALVAQVRVQEQLVADFATAAAADPALAARTAPLAAQAATQLDRLRAAAPSSTTAPSSPSSSSSAPAAASGEAPPPGGAAAWLRARVAAAAQSHTAAGIALPGARAALLGSVAAGLRGQDGLLT